MAEAVARLQCGRYDERQFVLTLYPSEDEGRSFPARLHEPGRPTRSMFAVLRERGDDRWFELKGPIRTYDENGKFVLRYCQNEAGELVDAQGGVVSDPAWAAQDYEVVRNRRTSEVVLGTLGRVSVLPPPPEGRSDQPPTCHLHLIRDYEARALAQDAARLKMTERGSDTYKFVMERIKSQRAALEKDPSANLHASMAIVTGVSFFRGQGFDLQGSDPDTSAAPEMAGP